MRPDIDNRPVCLALHGLGGSPAELAPLIDRLIEEGCPVVAPILPGHDFEALGPVMPGSTWPEWIVTAEAAFDELARSGRPVVVVGFSTGGTLGLLLATRRPIARLVLLAPFLAIKLAGLIPLDPSTAVRVLAMFMPDPPRRSAPIRDREARRRYDALPRFRTFSLGATLSALELIEQVKPLVPTIRTPTLILQGRLDSVVDPGGASWLIDHLGSASRRLVLFDRSDHLLTLDSERDEVVDEAASFVLARGD